MNKWYMALDPESGAVEHWEEIKGAQPVVIEGWGEFDFCVHKIAGPSLRGWWRITEGRTGAALLAGFTPADAVACTRRYLEEVGKARFEAKRAELVERFGLSPRYAEERSES